MSYYQKNSFTLAMLAALVILPAPLMREQLIKPVSAQSAPSVAPVIPSLPSGSQVKIDGSSSLKTINQNLKDRFEQHFSGTKVEAGELGTDEAIKALEAGTIDLAAIGRPLTQTEEGQGLKQVPISRHKIAIIISPNNPFKGDITLEQFAKIFRGEIKNWSEVGGAAGEIQVIDRPETSDTRRSFGSYPVFQNAPLKTGSNGVSVTEDDTEMVVQKLGENGIGYAIVDQVRDRKDVKIVLMHKTLPTDPRYPFSQPLAYAYKGPNPNPQVKAFLCYANTSDYAKEDAIVSTEFCDEKKIAADAMAPATAPITPETPPSDSFPNWLGWLLLPLAGLAGWWFLGRGSAATPVVAPVAAPVPIPPPIAIAKPSSLILTPRDCKNAYAYWDVAGDRLQKSNNQNDQKLALRLYDVTDTLNPTVFETFDVDGNEQDLNLPIKRDDRDYRAELGYVTRDGAWLNIATSEPVRVPACRPVSNELNTVGRVGENIFETNTIIPEKPAFDALKTGSIVAGLGAVGAGAAALFPLDQQRTTEITPSRIVLVPRDSQSAYAHWEISEAEKTELKQQGGEQFVLKIHEVTDMQLEGQIAHDTQEYVLDDIEQDRHVPIHVSDRDYLAEIGYKTGNNLWLSLAKSSHIRIPADSNPSNSNSVSTVNSTFADEMTSSQPENKTALGSGSNVAIGAIGAVTGLAGGLFSQEKDFTQSNIENIGDSASNLVEGTTQTGGNILDSATGFLGNMLDQGKETISGGVDSIKSTGEKIRDSAGNIIDSDRNVLDSANNLVEGTTQKGGNILDSATGFLGNMFDQGKETISGGVDSIKSTGEKIRDSAGNVIDSDSQKRE